MGRLGVNRSRIGNDIVACLLLVLLQAYSMGLTPYIESSNQLSLIMLSTLSLCIVIASGSRTAATAASMMLSATVVAGEVVQSLSTNDELLLARGMGSFVGAAIAAFMMRREYKAWEVVAIFCLSFGIGMVSYRPVMDKFDWPPSDPAYHLTAAFMAASVGMLVMFTVYSKWFGQWIRSKFKGVKDASDTN